MIAIGTIRLGVGITYREGKLISVVMWEGGRYAGVTLWKRSRRCLFSLISQGLALDHGSQ
jgi:hypothetical protein